MVLALICPGPSSPDQTPVILGTNANLFKRLAQLCKDSVGVDLAQTLGIAVDTAAEDLSLNTAKLTSECTTAEDHVGSIIWQGPGSLNLPADGDCCAICSVELAVPLESEVLMVEPSPSVTLPVGGITATDDGS